MHSTNRASERIYRPKRAEVFEIFANYLDTLASRDASRTTTAKLDGAKRATR